MTRSMAGCPLTRVNHALAMNEEEIENHFNEIHDELQAYKKQLDSLKEDLK
jgi:predicted  nucleic acid-binding Zn-ribbon protein